MSHTPSLLLENKHIPNPAKRPVEPPAMPSCCRKRNLAPRVRLMKQDPALAAADQLLELPGGAVELLSREQTRRCHRVQEVVPGDLAWRRRHVGVEEQRPENLE